MTPVSRVEMYLAKICGEDVELPIPQTRKEVFLAIIAGESYEKPVPSSRVELYLAKILGDDVPLPLPQSREEIFLAAIAGVEYPLPYPESRIEYWLHKWATYEEWSTISGNPVSFTAKAAPLRQLSVAFSPVQSGTGDPSPDNMRPISGWSSLTVYHSGADTSNPQTISISLGETVYSGTVDVVTGVGGDSGSKISFAPNQISTWFNEDASRDTLGFYMQANDFKARYPAPLNASALFEEYKTQRVYTNYTPWIANVLFVSGNFNRFEARVPKSVLAPFSTYAESVAAVLAYLAEHPIVMWYEKAEPTPISLTPQEVQSLAGDNTMWTDAASLEVTYRSN